MIKSVTIKNLKGITDHFEFGDGINYIYGPNGSGKTAVIDAICLCLTGEHPVFGKQKSTIATLMSGPTMECKVVTTEGVFTYILEKNKKGAVTRTHDVPLEGNEWQGRDIVGLSNPEVWKSTPAVLINWLIGLSENKILPGTIIRCIAEDKHDLERLDFVLNRKNLTIDDCITSINGKAREYKAQLELLESRVSEVDEEVIRCAGKSPAGLEAEKLELKKKYQEIKAMYDRGCVLYDEFKGVEVDQGKRSEYWKQKIQKLVKKSKLTRQSIDGIENEVSKHESEIKRLEEESRKVDKVISETQAKVSHYREIEDQFEGDECPLCGSKGAHLAKTRKENKAQIKEWEAKAEEAENRGYEIDRAMGMVKNLLQGSQESLKTLSGCLSAELAEIEESEKSQGSEMVKINEYLAINPTEEHLMEWEQEMEILEDQIEGSIRESSLIVESRKKVEAINKDKEMALELESMVSLFHRVTVELKAQKKQIIDKAISGLIEASNELLKGGRVALRFDEEDGLTSNRGIPLKGLSGAEYALVSAALMMALDSRIIVLDEIDRLDTESKTTILGNFKEISEENGFQSQVFALGVSNPPKGVESFSTIIAR